MRPQVGKVLSRESEGEIVGESSAITPELLVQTLGGHTVKAGQVGIQYAALPAEGLDQICDTVNWGEGRLAIGFHDPPTAASALPRFLDPRLRARVGT